MSSEVTARMDHSELLADNLLSPAAAQPGAGGAAPPLPPSATAADRLLPSAEIKRALGQTVQEALDLHGWEDRGGLEALLTRAYDLVVTSVREEGRLRS